MTISMTTLCYMLAAYATEGRFFHFQIAATKSFSPFRALLSAFLRPHQGPYPRPPTPHRFVLLQGQTPLSSHHYPVLKPVHSKAVDLVDSWTLQHERRVSPKKPHALVLYPLQSTNGMVALKLGSESMRKSPCSMKSRGTGTTTHLLARKAAHRLMEAYDPPEEPRRA